MKKIRDIISITIVIVTLLTTSIPAFAFSENESRSVENFFIEAQMLKGDGSSYGLDNSPTRMEGIVILIRLLGKEAEAQQMQSLPCRFLDVPVWAVGYANYAYAENISMGVSDTLFGTNDLMTAQQFNTLLLRTIGYDDSQGDFEWSDAVGKANKLGILSDDLAEWYEDSADYTKRDLIETSFCFLEGEYKDEDITMIAELIDAGVISEQLAEDYGLAVEQWDSITTNFSDDEFFRFDLDGNVISITGKSSDKDKKWILVQIKNKDTGVKKSDKVDQRDQDGEHNLAVTVANLQKGEYYVDLYSNDEKYNYYSSVILSSLTLKVTVNDAYFIPSPAYGKNLRYYKGNQIEGEDKLMNLLTRTTKENIDRVNDLAEEITAGSDSDYEKIQAIHDWVAENIYYDQDFLSGKTKTTNIGTMSVLENKFAVCSGYSNLTKDLISASGIPCKQVFGFALGISEEEDGWEDVNLEKIKANHVWNEAYVDGRWIIIDTTWDSSNSYEGGDFTEGDAISQLYYDVTMEFFSNTHKSMFYDVQ